MESLQDVWNLIKTECKNIPGENNQPLTDIAFKTWIEPLQIKSIENGVALILVDSEFKLSIVFEHYYERLRQAFYRTLGFEVEIKLITETAYSEQESSEKKTGLSYSEDYVYTFDTFVIGSSNKFAHAAAQAVAANPGGAYNPLFIYGNSGLGKTHLLNAICYDVRKSYPGKNIIYTRGEDFTNELVDYIAAKNTGEFHNKYRSADVLLVDDIQFIAGKIQTQEEFFHTFNTLNQAGKQIVLTSDRPPKEIQALQERLLTRFEWGLLADIQPPDFETRMAIIKTKAQQLHFNIPDDVVEYIAERLKKNIRQLEGTVKNLKAKETMENQKPSIMVAKNVIKDILSDIEPLPITVEHIISEVGRTYGVSPEDIRSTKRNASTSKARQVSMYVIREITNMSMEAIGAEFGGRDHSTVIYALGQVEKAMEKDNTLKATVNDIIKNIRDR